MWQEVTVPVVTIGTGPVQSPPHGTGPVQRPPHKTLFTRRQVGSCHGLDPPLGDDHLNLFAFQQHRQPVFERLV
jgi:hypothetical protein